MRLQFRSVDQNGIFKIEDWVSYWEQLTIMEKEYLRNTAAKLCCGIARAAMFIGVRRNRK